MGRGEWAETADTADGTRIHARVDTPAGRLPDAGTADEEAPAPFRTRALTLSSERHGVIAKMDAVEGEGHVAVPVDYKRGKRPHIAQGVYQPERVQLCLQAMLLEEAGYEVPEAAIWYAASRERVPVRLDDDLRAATLTAVSGLRLAAAAARRPPPLENSPKCPHCALAGICLPDEVNLFRKGHAPRRLDPADDPALPLHVQAPGARIRKAGETLVVETDEGRIEVPMIRVSDLVLHGNVSVTTPALHALMRAEVPVAWHSTGGWFLGLTTAPGTAGLDTRIAQHRAAAEPTAALRVAAGLVAAKIRNQRTMLRRNWKADATDARDEAMKRLKRLAEAAPHVRDANRLLGLEGEAAAIYFRNFDALLGARSLPAFSFQTRNRRPPTDPINALLSFAYALATRAFTVALLRAGFDPYLGLYHRPRHGRPALALDMMEPFRPLLADSTVLTVINNGEVVANDFVFNGPSCALKPAARKALIAAWERRLDQQTTHPVFGYRIAMRRLIAVQCRLLARHLTNEIPQMPHYIPR